MRTEEQKARAAEVAAKWRENNPERYKEQQTRYRIKNSEKKAAKAKEWREKNPEKFAASRDRWLAENKPKMAESNRKACQAYYHRNPEQYIVRGEKRRAARLERTVWEPTEFDLLVWEEAARLRVLREKCTRIRWHVDHMIPLQCGIASGLHVGVNMQVIPAKLNLGKKNRLVLTEPGQWLAFT